MGECKVENEKCKMGCARIRLLASPILHFALCILHSIWRARWWIVASIALCAVDVSIRHKVFHTGAWHDARLCAFYSVAAIAPAFLLGRFTRFVAPEIGRAHV